MILLLKLLLAAVAATVFMSISTSASSSPTMSPTSSVVDPSQSMCWADYSNQYYGVRDCLGGSVYLFGTYMAIGIHNAGSLGANGTVIFYGSEIQISIVADFDRNGFNNVVRIENVSTATGYYAFGLNAVDFNNGSMEITYPGYSGDFFTPGIPTEGL